MLRSGYQIIFVNDTHNVDIDVHRQNAKQWIKFDAMLHINNGNKLTWILHSSWNMFENTQNKMYLHANETTKHSIENRIKLSTAYFNFNVNCISSVHHSLCELFQFVSWFFAIGFSSEEENDKRKTMFKRNSEITIIIMNALRWNGLDVIVYMRDYGQW